MASSLAMARQLNPSLSRSRTTSSRRQTRRGLPRVLPYARAARMPAMVLSRMSETSISAKALWSRKLLVLGGVQIFEGSQSCHRASGLHRGEHVGDGGSAPRAFWRGGIDFVGPPEKLAQ